MVNREVITFVDYFNRPHTITTTPTMNGWTIKDTSSGGTPTYAVATADGGGLRLLTDNTSEAQVVTLYHNDILCFDVDLLQRVQIVCKVAGVDSVSTIVWGVAAAQNDTADSIVTNAWFRMQGSASTSNVVVETDDATNDLDDKATGKTLSTTYKTFEINFMSGVDNVKFYIDGERVADGTTFDMSDLTAGLNVQPFVQLQKASGTGVPEITIKKFLIQYTEASGA